jgi:perosamine synthetase
VAQSHKVSEQPIRLAWPDVGVEEARAVAEVLETGHLTMGPKVEEFEAELARACEVEHCVVVSSGTAALHAALLALEIGPGDEVIVPAYTFPASANVVVLAGATVRLVDVDPRTMNLDVERVADAVTPKTRAVISVHLFGRPLDWESLEAAVPEHVSLIEDAAGALGARQQRRLCGSLGIAGCLSFHPRKIVTTGEGGAVTTNDAAIAEAVRRIRHHGIEPHGEFEISTPSTNYRLSDVLCAIGISQVHRLRDLLAERARIAAAYSARLDGVVQTPAADEGDQHGWQAYVVQLEERDRVLQALGERGIEAQIGTYALHRLSAYSEQGPFPGADECFARALALPFHTRLTEGEIDRVADAVRTAVE